MRVLFLSPWYPFPLENGSKIRIYHLLKTLSQSHELHLISFIRQGERIDPGGLNGICSSIETVAWIPFKPGSIRALAGYFALIPRSDFDTFSPEMQSKLDQKIDMLKPDVVICSEFNTAAYAVKSEGTAWIFDDLEFKSAWDRWQTTNSRLGRFRKGLSWYKLSRYTNRLLSKFDVCTVVSEVEKETLQNNVALATNVHIIPNGVDTDILNFQAEYPRTNTLVYNGSLTYKANFDAMRFFLRDIFPRIIAINPSARLTITGSLEGVDTSQLNLNQNVTLTGYLPEIHKTISNSWACVVPIKTGSGTRIKILEAMALGTPVVSTSKGAEGLMVSPGEDILIADNPDDFAHQTLKLLNNQEIRGDLTKNARSLVEAKYDWDKIGKKFVQIVEESTLTK